MILGVRPEKMRIERGDATPTGPGHNSVTGIVTDASFFGVSTQYLVRTDWGQELVAFEQNATTMERVRPGETVNLSWDAAHSFGLHGEDDLGAGVEGGILGVGVRETAGA